MHVSWEGLDATDIPFLIICNHRDGLLRFRPNWVLQAGRYILIKHLTIAPPGVPHGARVRWNDWGIAWPVDVPIASRRSRKSLWKSLMTSWTTASSRPIPPRPANPIGNPGVAPGVADMQQDHAEIGPDIQGDGEPQDGHGLQDAMSEVVPNVREAHEPQDNVEVQGDRDEDAAAVANDAVPHDDNAPGTDSDEGSDEENAPDAGTDEGPDDPEEPMICLNGHMAIVLGSPPCQRHPMTANHRDLQRLLCTIADAEAERQRRMLLAERHKSSPLMWMLRLCP